MVPETRNELLVDDYFSQFQKNLLNKSQNNTSSALFVSIRTVMHFSYIEDVFRYNDRWVCA